MTLHVTLSCGRPDRPGRHRQCGPHRHLGRDGQHGAVLLTVLFLMLVLLMVSVSGMRGVLSSARSAQAERDRLVAHAAAEAALLDAEADIDGAAGPTSARSAVFVGPDADAFRDRCAGTGEREGLCRPVAPPGAPAWQHADLAGEAGVDYGRFSGRVLPADGGPLPARPPRYLIELLSGPGGAPLYRITAIGFGARAATTVVLQSYYRRAGTGTPRGAGGSDGTGGGPHATGTRLGWREIANWPDLHRAAS